MNSSTTMDQGSDHSIFLCMDFGTTRSAVAWAQTARPDIQSIIVQWPGPNGSLDGITREKVPTEICYRANGPLWGRGISASQQRYQWFKLSLCNDQKTRTSYLSVTYPDNRALPPSSNHSGVKLTTDYMTCVRKHAITILEQKLGKAIIATTNLVWIVTVPAIWSDAGKEATRACAKNAGMGDNVRMISEPEAAVVHSLDAMDPGTLKKGDTFVVVDAGGGTVDLITYVLSDHPSTKLVKVEEAARGDGHACGSVAGASAMLFLVESILIYWLLFLNRAFGKFLVENFADHPGWDKDTLDDAMQHFEDYLKRNFDENSLDIIVPVPGLEDDATKKIKRGKLVMSASAMRNIWEPVISTITALILTQINAVKVVKGVKDVKAVKAVLLVGGFGQSNHLRTCIRKVIANEIELIVPPHGETAVARGGLIKALAEDAPSLSRINVTSRVSRKSYGICLGVKHIKRTDPDKLRNVEPMLAQEFMLTSNRWWDSFNGCYRINKMRWFVKRGDKLQEAEFAFITFNDCRLVNEGPFHSYSTDILVHKGTEAPPIYPDKNTPELVSLVADLSAISTGKIPIRIGKDYEQYYSLTAEIRVTFHSASMEYALWYEGTCYGAVSAEYA